MTPEELKIKKQESWEDFFRTSDSSKVISKYSFNTGWDMCEKIMGDNSKPDVTLDKLVSEFEELKKEFKEREDKLKEEVKNLKSVIYDRNKIIEIQLEDKLKLGEELNNSMNYHCKHFKSTDNGYIACELYMDLKK